VRNHFAVGFVLLGTVATLAHRSSRIRAAELRTILQGQKKSLQRCREAMIKPATKSIAVGCASAPGLLADNGFEEADMAFSQRNLIRPSSMGGSGYSSGSSEQSDVQLRRATIGASIAGGAAMAAIRLLHGSLRDRLPDPHEHRLGHGAGGYAARETYVPRDAKAFLLHAANMALAAAGPADRAAKRPYLPLLASLATGAQALVSARYLASSLRSPDKHWCSYCFTDAVTHLATFALTLPEAAHAVRRLQRLKRR
jgi:hypothetical protein